MFCIPYAVLSTCIFAMVKLSRALLDRLRGSGAEILTAAADCWPYGGDYSRIHHAPDAVALVSSHEQVVSIVRNCYEEAVPVTARGHGTNTTGAAVPDRGGLVVSFERMRKVLDIDPQNRILRAETGITNTAIQECSKSHGFFWPPDPGSAEICTLGGNLACNAAGPRAVKYGTTRENTLGLRAVTGKGEEIVTGVQTTKGVVGLDLTRLLIGSEGTLALITEATLRLVPIPECRKTMRILYRSIEDAATAVAAITTQAFTPYMLELMDKTCLKLIRENSDVDLPAAAQAMLIVETDGNEQTAGIAAEAVQNSIAPHYLSIDTAANPQQAFVLLEARKALPPSLRKIAPGKINEDIVVPISKIPLFIRKTEALANVYGLPIANFGHVGNGNLHVNILFNPACPEQVKAAEECLEKVFDAVLKLGGTLSGEHGIGLTKLTYVNKEISETALSLMQDVTRIFDPKRILNRGKALPWNDSSFPPQGPH